MLPLLLLLPSLIHAQTACSRSYSNVTHIGAHDSFAVHAGSVAANQLYDVSTQLDNGIRMLQGQGHWSNKRGEKGENESSVGVFGEVDASFPCTKNRTNKAIDPSMYLMNHYLDTTFSLSLGTTPTQVYIPATDQLNKTNAATGVQSIGEQVDACVKEWGAPPTFVLVDFYHVVNGSVFQAAANINGVSYVARQVGNGTESSSTSTSGGSGSSGGSSNDNSAAAGRRTVGFAALMGLLGIGLGVLV
ncbi:hypothetical protein BT69DRAFT_1282116 [Atractiella rhizophila]|nr:hypothetical protein BT69DRAFT_1282116 [Atractiella rhizophila]